MSNDEVRFVDDTSAFGIPCSTFDIQRLAAHQFVAIGFAPCSQRLVISSDLQSRWALTSPTHATSRACPTDRDSYTRANDSNPAAKFCEKSHVLKPTPNVPWYGLSGGEIMIGRNIWLIAILAAAVVVPYHLSGDAQWTAINNWWQSMWTVEDGRGYDHYDSHRQPWPGAVGPPPVASASPLPPNYARRPIQSTRTSVAPHLAPQRGVAPSITSAVPQINSPPAPMTIQTRRPRFHDWMPVNQVEAPVPTSALGAADNGEVPLAGSQPRLGGPAAADIGQLLSFDVTPAWVMNNWQRVSTRLSEFDLEGLRVPIVTGTEIDDLVGTMTYYFDRRQTLQRISFDGFTGDPTRLVNVITSQFGLEVEAWLNAGLYVKRDDANQLASVLRIIHAPVIRSSEPRKRYAVEFELNRPDSEHGLSQHFAGLIEADRNSQAPNATNDENPAKTPAEKTATTPTNDGETDPQRQSKPANESGDTAHPNDSDPTPPVQPPPLNGSAESNAGAPGGGGGGQSGAGLYPSQLPNNWQKYVPPRP